jgi:S-DNA-T family DNA segregation ATPase FtsK/SpoIIIE
MRDYLETAATVVTVIWSTTVAGLLAWFVFGLVRFIRAPRAAKRNYWIKFRVRARWRHLTRSLGLVLISKETVKLSTRKSFGAQLMDGLLGVVAPVGLVVSIFQNMGLSAFDDAVGHSTRKRKIKYPRMRIRADEFGVVLRVRTVPGVGREEIEKHAQHLADAWRVDKVQVFPMPGKPGRLIVRAVKTDPLTVPLDMSGAPAGVYDNPDPVRPYLGRDEWARHRRIDLTGITGFTVGGLARYGKTSLVVSLMLQWGASPAVQFVLLDGKGNGRQVGADYTDWVPRAWMASGDDLDEAEKILKRVVDHMRERGRVIHPVLGVRNGWHHGPTPEFPLIIVIVDECHTYFDASGKSGKAKEQILRLQSLAAEIPRKGGSTMMLGVFMTQKQTGDAIPTAIRDNCTIGVSFAVKTRDAAKAGLGEGISEWPSACPTTLRERPTFVGCFTGSLADGAETFIRLRGPYISDAFGTACAGAVAFLRTDPDETLAALTVRAGVPPKPVEAAAA